ncbi:MAG: hypothetical protein U0736_12140 [Gemmataceae bacterium]
MAQPHTNDYTNPEVRYERTDASLKEVITFGTFLLVLALVAVFSMYWFAGELLRWDRPRKSTTLPAAEVDKNKLSPGPRLEAFEDIDQRDPRLFPARGADYLKPQEEVLKQGNPKRNVEPIAAAIDQLAGRLPTREGAIASPASNPVRLPSKAASGRTETGGK